MSVCLSVCLSAYIHSRTTGYETAHERYERLKRNKVLKNNVADFAKGIAFKVIASEQANMLISFASWTYQKSYEG